MNKLAALLKLIRWPNLVFIALAQALVYFCIVTPDIGCATNFPITEFLRIVVSTVLIAAAGYMLNDYFDIRIDSINKPDKVVLSKIISRKAMIIWHVILNIIALSLVVGLAYQNQLRLLSIQIVCILALIVYSASFKRRLFVGNLLVAFLIALSVLLVGIYSVGFKVLSLAGSNEKLLWLYALFAFLITLVREIIKDAEDLKGDIQEGCQTIPIVYGLELTKKIIYFIYILLLGLLSAFIAKLFTSNAILCIYFVVGVMVPSIFLLRKIQQAKSTSDFAKLSTWVKWLTLSGIISMLLIQL